MELRSPGYVYVLSDRENGTYKIGRTKNLEQRVRSIRTGNPNRIDLVAYAMCEDTVQAEKRVHNLYTYRRRKGKEWFDLTDQEVEELKTLLLRITTDFKHEKNINRYVLAERV